MDFSGLIDEGQRLEFPFRRVVSRARRDQLLPVLGWILMISIVLFNAVCILQIPQGIDHDSSVGVFAMLQYEAGITSSIREERSTGDTDLLTTERSVHSWHAPGYQFFPYAVRRICATNLGDSIRIVRLAFYLLGVVAWTLVTGIVIPRNLLPWVSALLILSIHFNDFLPLDRAFTFRAGFLSEWATVPLILWSTHLVLRSPPSLKRALLSLAVGAGAMSLFLLKYSTLRFTAGIAVLLGLGVLRHKRELLSVLLPWLGGVGAVRYALHRLEVPGPSYPSRDLVGNVLHWKIQHADAVFESLRSLTFAVTGLDKGLHACGATEWLSSRASAYLVVAVWGCFLWAAADFYRSRTDSKPSDRPSGLGSRFQTPVVVACAAAVLHAFLGLFSSQVDYGPRFFVVIGGLLMPVLLVLSVRLASARSPLPRLLLSCALVLFFVVPGVLHHSLMWRQLRSGRSTAHLRNSPNGITSPFVRARSSDEEFYGEIASLLKSDQTVLCSDFRELPVFFFDALWLCPRGGPTTCGPGPVRGNPPDGVVLVLDRTRLSPSRKRAIVERFADIEKWAAIELRHGTRHVAWVSQ